MILPETVRLGLFATLPLAGGMLSAMPAHPSKDIWYESLRKPPLCAPKSLFAPVWTVVYLGMGYAAYRVDGSPLAASRRALTWFGVQLALNYAWTPLFFHYRQLGAAAIEVGLLGYAVVRTAGRFARVDELAGRLMLPYVAWVAYASYLTVGVWWLNRGHTEAKHLEAKARKEAEELKKRLDK